VVRVRSVGRICHFCWSCIPHQLSEVRLDLYDRRFDVYARTLDFYHALLAWQPTDLEKSSHSLRDSPELGASQKAFIKAKQEALFLFAADSGIQEHLEKIHEDSIGIIGAKRDLFPNLSG